MTVSKTVTYEVTCDSCGEAHPDYGEPLEGLDVLTELGWTIEDDDDGEPASALCPDCAEAKITQDAPGLLSFFQYLSVEALASIRIDLEPFLDADEDAQAANLVLQHHARTFLGHDDLMQFYGKAAACL